MKKFLSVLLVLIAMPAFSDSSSFSEAANALCQKQKSCITQQVNSDEVPPQMRQMMLQMVDSVCESMQQNFDAASTESHPMYSEAVSCMNSMAELDCQSLQQGSVKTEACEAYQRKAETFTGN
jgi:hypothetical protein